MRNSVIAAMLDLEEHIKEAAADVIAKSFDVNQNDYLLYKNYQNKRKYKSRFTFTTTRPNMELFLHGYCLKDNEEKED